MSAPLLLSLLVCILPPASPAPNFDVLVYGSTPSAIVCAVAAARMNVSVGLLDTAARLGGLMSGGLGYTDVGDSFALGGLAHELFLANARAYNASATRPLYQVEPHVVQALFVQLLQGAGVAYLAAPGQAIASVSRQGSRITGLDLGSGSAYTASLFVDGSYEGDLLVASGVPHTSGRESSAQYNESWAGRREPFGFPFDLRPISPLDASGQLLPLLTARTFAPLHSGDSGTQGYNFRLCVVKRSQSPGNFLPFPQPQPYDPSRWELLRRLAALPGMDTVEAFVALGPLPGGQKYDLNNGALLSTDYTGASQQYPLANASARAAIRQQHLQYTLQLFHALATDAALPPSLRASAADLGLCADEFLAAQPRGWPEQLYVREVLRLVGERVLAQGDVWAEGAGGGLQPAMDWGSASIGLGSYAADGHYVGRGPCEAYNSTSGRPACSIVTSEAQLQAAAAAGRLWTGGEGYVGPTNQYMLYQVPYFALLPARSTSNLLSPTCPSVTHVVFASLRVEPTFMVLGHAAGVAAALAAQQGLAVQDVSPAQVHQALAAQGAVLCKDKFPHC
jgi:hypothetical protein